jgi:hypothetical protein
VNPLAGSTTEINQHGAECVADAPCKACMATAIGDLGPTSAFMLGQALTGRAAHPARYSRSASMQPSQQNFALTMPYKAEDSRSRLKEDSRILQALLESAQKVSSGKWRGRVEKSGGNSQ